MIMSGTGGDVDVCVEAWFMARYGLLFLLESARGAINGLDFAIKLVAILTVCVISNRIF